METEPLQQRPPAQSSRVRTVLGLSAALAILVIGQVMILNSEPTSHGMTVSEWLNETNRQYYVWGTNFEAVATGFGTKAAPYFYSALIEPQPRSKALWTQLREFLKLPGLQTIKPHARRDRAFWSLIRLGKLHPAIIDPYFATMLETTNRAMAISALGVLGNRHLAILTNFVAGTNQDDAITAVWSLRSMGTNAQAAVPVIVARSRELASYSGNWDHLLALSHIGQNDPRVLDALLALMTDPEEHARQRSTVALASMTNQYHLIAPVFLETARQTFDGTNDAGLLTCLHLRRVGVSAGDAVPELLRRLELAIYRDGADERAPETANILSYLALYGTDASPAIAVIERETLLSLYKEWDRDLMIVGGPTRTLRQTISKIEMLLQSIDPSWKPPANKRP
ncbi:MAG: hypothetical protein ACJASX_001371 [Limisphaerales bacterium]|jgi:hypothetical protein